MHLETILKDLRERFARCELAVSPPLVAFRESVAAEAEAADAAAPRPARVRMAPVACFEHNCTCTCTCTIIHLLLHSVRLPPQCLIALHQVIVPA